MFDPLELYLLLFVVLAGALYLFNRIISKPEAPSRRPHLHIRSATQHLRWAHYRKDHHGEH